MTELETKFCGTTLLHGWHHWYREGDGIKEEDPVMVRCDGLEKKLCPDGGVCHHMCGTEGYPDKCFRVRFAGPLSGVFPENKWPKALREEHGAWQKFDTMIEVVEQRIFDSIADDAEVTPCPHSESRNNVWMCLDCVAEVGMKTTLELVLDRIEAMAVEAEDEADKAGRDNPTLRTIKLIRAQGMRDVITTLEKEL